MSTPVEAPSNANILLFLGVTFSILIGGRLFFIFEDQLKMRHRLENEVKRLQIAKIEIEIAQLKAKKD